ncbi:Demethylphylloquinone reductase NdbB [Clarias magur]|uniref:Demethylphylloquinone reductase NdbB n=1 Tax=Clarias magur TaxID=1594786 RepID=A0A8J4XA13_CLAMG|nr:Demethylphylloquinone reductase NdbB [Clarias magur]
MKAPASLLITRAETASRCAWLLWGSAHPRCLIICRFQPGDSFSDGGERDTEKERRNKQCVKPTKKKRSAKLRRGGTSLLSVLLGTLPARGLVSEARSESPGHPEDNHQRVGCEGGGRRRDDEKAIRPGRMSAT